MWSVNLYLGCSQSTGLDTPCEKAKNDIYRRIQGMPATYTENYLEHIERDEGASSDDDFAFDEMVESNEQSEMNILSWTNDIVNEATIAVQEEDDGDRDNLMENKPFAAYFINLCHMLPVWSAVSCKFFDSPNLIGSSWSSETGFKNTKQLHGDALPSSADEFVKRDLEFNNSTVIDASKKYLITMQSDPNTSIDQPNETESSSIENDKMPSFEKEHEDNGIEPHCDEVCSQEDDRHDDRDEQVEKQASDVCPACADGNLPTGSHMCHSCNKPVHALVQCSVSIGDPEGHGQKRECISCHQSAKKRTEQSETTKALNEQEKWARTKRTRGGKYLNPQPNFGLVPVNKKVSIPLLLNENTMKNVYNIDRKRVKLSNTCAFDAIIQLIAAAMAYHSKYRLWMARAKDGILTLAKMLAQG